MLNEKHLLDTIGLSVCYTSFYHVWLSQNAESVVPMLFSKAREEIIRGISTSSPTGVSTQQGKVHRDLICQWESTYVSAETLPCLMTFFDSKHKGSNKLWLKEFTKCVETCLEDVDRTQPDFACQVLTTKNSLLQLVSKHFDSNPLIKNSVIKVSPTAYVPSGGNVHLPSRMYVLRTYSRRSLYSRFICSSTGIPKLYLVCVTRWTHVFGRSFSPNLMPTSTFMKMRTQIPKREPRPPIVTLEFIEMEKTLVLSPQRGRYSSI